MYKTHVTPEQLFAWLDEEPGNDTVGWHVQHCDMCARHLADERLFRNLIRWKPGRKPAGNHVDDELLAAYAEEKLQPYEMTSISSHIIECDRCLLSLIDLRYMIHATDEHAPDGDVFGSIAERMGELLQRWLGKMQITIDKASAVIQWDPSPYPVLPPMFPDANVSEQTMFELDSFSLKKGMDQYVTFNKSAIQTKEPSSDHTGVDAGDYHLSFRVSPDAGMARLFITVTGRDNHRPISELPIMLILSGPESVSSLSDSAGQVVFLLDQGDVELQIGVTPEWKMTISIESIFRKS